MAKIKIGTVSQKEIARKTKLRATIRQQSGAGVHGNTKYDRNRQKRLDRKEVAYQW